MMAATLLLLPRPPEQHKPISEPLPALNLQGVWKLFGPRRRVSAALAALDQAGGRAAMQRSHCVFAAVAGIDLQVNRLEILAIVGASGSGKSTLVRHMNGLIQPSRGEVYIDGTRIGSLSARALQHLRSTQIGMVFQNTSLFPYRNAIENVVFGLEVQRLPHRERYRIAREWLDRVELGEWATHFPDALSGGMQQRVGLARTFATDPEILLLDEPFSALDAIILRSLQNQFVALVRSFRKTAVFITHDFAEAVRIADRIGVMAEGRIIQIGTPREIIANPATPYVASFATASIRRSFVCAADIAAPAPDRPRAQLLAADTTLAAIIALLQAEDTVFQVTRRDGTSAGIIDRGILLAYLAQSLDAVDY